MRQTHTLGLALISAVALSLALPCLAADTTITYTFNTADQLTQVSSSQSGVLASFTYDGDGQRISKTSAVGQTIYVRGALGEIIAEYSGTGQLLAEYVYLDGQRLCKITHDAQGIERRVYYHADIVGTPVALTNESGQPIVRAEYYPFGEQVVPGAAADPHKFSGKELDDESGLYYFGARYYDANLGRFISVDPVAGKNIDPQSWNRYAYGKNNPLRFIDPTGEAVFESAEKLDEAGTKVVNRLSLQPVRDASGKVTQTYCNFGVQAILHEGADNTLDKMKAAAMTNYLSDPAHASPLSYEEAVTYAEEGATVVMAENTSHGGEGHVAIVAPRQMQQSGPRWGRIRVPQVFSVGSTNGTDMLSLFFEAAHKPQAYILNADKQQVDTWREAHPGD